MVVVCCNELLYAQKKNFHLQKKILFLFFDQSINQPPLPSRRRRQIVLGL